MNTLRKFTGTSILIMFCFILNAQTQIVVFKCNFDCPSCEEKVMKNIPYEKGVKAVNVDYKNMLVTVEFKKDKNSANGIQKALVKLGYNTQILGTPTTFWVNGNCDLCKDRIEKAALNVKGVTSASWDQTDKQLTIIMSSDSPNDNEIHKSIAKVGHDTQKEKATSEVYNNLHGCCKYPRE